MSSGRRIHIDKNGFLEPIEIIASRNLLASDDKHILEVNSMSAVTLTIPNETTLPYTKVRTYTLFRTNTGQVLFAQEVGITVIGGITEIADTTTVTGGAVLITHVGVNKYYITGKEV